MTYDLFMQLLVTSFPSRLTLIIVDMVGFLFFFPSYFSPPLSRVAATRRVETPAATPTVDLGNFFFFPTDSVIF